MAKDPFKNVPKVEPDLLHDHEITVGEPSSSGSASDDVSKGTTPKKMLDGLMKWVMIGGAASVFAWVLMPSNGPQRKKVKVDEVAVVDQSRQIADTNSLLNNLKDQAKNTPPPAQPTPGAPPVALDANGKPLPAGAIPGGYPNGNTQSQNGAGQYPAAPNRMGNPLAVQQSDIDIAASHRQREEEIRGAPLEVQGPIKLLADSTPAPQKTSTNLTQLQDDIAALNAKKEAAAQGQNDSTNRLLASLQPPAAVKSRGSNENFLATQAAANGGPKYLQQQAPVSQTMIQEGTFIRAVLLTNVSSDLPGKITAMVTSDVHDSIFRRFVLIPKGSFLVGAYSSDIVVGQESLLIAMTRLILPDGSWIALGGAPATNVLGQSGMKADVNNHFLKMFGTSFILGATSLFLPSSQSTVSTTAGASGNLTTGSVAGLALNDALNNMMQRNKNINPTLSASYGMEFQFMVAQDMAMVPYRKK